MNSSQCRVEKIHRIHYIADSRRDPQNDDWNTVWTWAVYRKNYLHINVQRHSMVGRRKGRNVYCEFQNCGRSCEKIRGRSLVVSWAWIRKEVVRNTHTYKPNGEWDRVAEDMMLNFSETGHPVFPDIQCFGTTRFEKQKERKFVCTLLWRRQKTVEVVLRTIISSISSVSTEQWQTCATSWLAESLIVQNVQGNLLLRTIQKLRFFLKNCWQRTNRFGPMRTCKETCCTFISFNWPNYAPM